MREQPYDTVTLCRGSSGTCASLALPTGETSNTMVADIARHGLAMAVQW